MTYRLLVTGARDWPAELESVVRAELMLAWRGCRILGSGDSRRLVVVHGACPSGADLFAARWVAEHAGWDVADEPHPADWQAHGKAAGPIRNRQMVEAGADRCVAFLLPHSRGSRGTADMAEAAGIPTRRIRPDGAGRELGGAA